MKNGTTVPSTFRAYLLTSSGASLPHCRPFSSLIQARAAGKMGDNYCSVHSLYDECTSWDDGTDDKKAIHLSDQAKECVYVTLRADLDTRLVDLVSWNDSKSRTQEEVLDLFDRTIERVKKNI